MAVIQCNGADLYYEDFGEGQPIVFLHGVLHGLRFFEPQLAGLSDEYRAIAFDCRGHGRSEKTELGHTVPQYARDLHAFLEQRGLGDVVLVGWSMGAFVSWDYVDQFGTDRIRGLVDVDIEATRFKWNDYDYGLARLEDVQSLLELAQTDQQGLIDQATEQVFADPTAEMRALQYDEISRTPPPIQSAILFDTHTRDYRSVLPKIDVPMLVCAGAAETRGSVDAVRHVAELVPEARVELFNESGHAPPFEEPERFNQVVSQFVDSL
ncbi:alpha/beta fold hydrolase [Natronobeatus ordinarius]|uniref:alpha/beta fold hydrolase n=1 Tax=Natronobeatus ordinarius TaxID=2963433 RepID=UPI0020CC75E0|nr:alpha/beta hydrolase [Natronobeatus ordinarius]